MTSTTSLHSIGEENEDRTDEDMFISDGEDNDCGCSDSDDEDGGIQAGSPPRLPLSVRGHSSRHHGGACEHSTVASLAAVVRADARRGDEAACDIAKKTLLNQLEDGGGLDAFLALMQPFTMDSGDDEMSLPSIDGTKNSPPQSPMRHPRVPPTPSHEVRGAGAKLSSLYEDHYESV